MNLARLINILIYSIGLEYLLLLKIDILEIRYFGKTSIDIHDNNFHDSIPSFTIGVSSRLEFQVLGSNFKVKYDLTSFSMNLSYRRLLRPVDVTFLKTCS